MSYKDTGFKTKKEFDEFCEIMDGMNDVNSKMVDDIEVALSKEQPICHFTKMNFVDGLWICEHCEHEIETEVAPCDYDYIEY